MKRYRVGAKIIVPILFIMLFSITIFPSHYNVSYSVLTPGLGKYHISSSVNHTKVTPDNPTDKNNISHLKLSAGTDQTVQEDSIVLLKGNIKGGTFKYNLNCCYWRQVSPKIPQIPLKQVLSGAVQFKAPKLTKTTVYLFSVTGLDQEGNKYFDTVKIKVLHSNININSKKAEIQEAKKSTNSVNNEITGQPSRDPLVLRTKNNTSAIQERTEHIDNLATHVSNDRLKSTMASVESKLKHVEGDQINNQYIVVLKSNTAPSIVSSLVSKSRTEGAQIPFVFDRVLKGFTIKVPKVSFLNHMLNLSEVAYIEPDYKVKIFGQTLPTGINRIDGDLSKTKSGDGQGSVSTDIAILDTGISLSHPDLNVFRQANFVTGASSAQDGNGHGTHVAGIAAAEDNSAGVVGVAPGARLWAVKVLDDSGQGSISTVIKGIGYVTEHADEIDAANISFGCTCESQALDTAIHNSVLAGVTYSVAAGNDGKDASATSPANHPDVITVSAIVDTDGKCGGLGASSSSAFGKDDNFASFSNYGPKIDIAAPGVNIYSTYKGSSYAYASGYKYGYASCDRCWPHCTRHPTLTRLPHK